MCGARSKDLAPATRKALRIGGIAKGSGMINPAMATMFAFLTTDAAITLPALRTAAVGEGELERMTVENPARILTIAEPRPA